jgi:hypothetical protein
VDKIPINLNGDLSMKKLNIILLSTLFVSFIGACETKSIFLCGIEVVNIGYGDQADEEPIRLTVLTDDELFEALPDWCPEKAALYEAVKERNSAKERLIEANKNFNKILKSLPIDIQGYYL